MAANTITITSILANEVTIGSPSAGYTLNVNLGAATAGLVVANFSVLRVTSSAVTPIAVNTATASGSNTVYTLAFTNADDTHKILQTDSLLIQINNDPNYSNRVFLEIDAANTATGIDYFVQMPVQTGDYKLNDATSDGETLTTTASSQFTVLDTTDQPAKATLTMPKAYLSKFVGEIYPANIKLYNSTDDLITIGEFEVGAQIDKQ